MKKIQGIALGLVLILSYQCKQAKKDMNDATEEVQESMDMAKDQMTDNTLTVNLEPKNDSGVSGQITFTQKDGMVTMHAELSGLKEGEHAIHIHEKADCSADDGSSAGGHWNPTGEPHGKWGDAGGYHRGDIGNLVADADGNATMDFSTGEWCLGCDDPKMDLMGKGVIVHEGADDFTSQPSGAAGSRIACAGIIK